MDYQPRVPVADLYVSALGRATYNFTYLEWGIVWLAETMQPEFIGAVGSLTAGQIASKFEKFVDNLTDAESNYTRLKALAAEFIKLVGQRNKLMHSKPFTAEGGEQRLLYDGKSGRQDWSIEDIIGAARSFEVAAIEAGYLLHDGRLQAYQQATGQSLVD
jgi:hypothetical protein